MKSRRQFVIDNVAAWFLAPDLAKRIEWFSDHQEKPYLQTIKKPKVKLYAQWEDNYYHLTYGESREGDFLEEITWGDYFSDYVGIDPKDNKSILEWGKIFLDLSKKGLERRNEINKSGKNETIYLKHIEEIINNKKTRAEMLIDQYNKSQDLNFLINHDENFSYSGF